MRYDDKKVYKCFERPPEGNFIVGKSYNATPIIDGTAIIDEDGKHIPFGEIVALWYFKHEEMGALEII